LIIGGQETKPHGDPHKTNSADKGKDAANASGETVITINQQTPEGQENDHATHSPSVIREYLLPPNVLNLALVMVGIAGIIAAFRTLKIIRRQTKAAEKAAETALVNTEAFIHSQRPWVSIKTALASPLTYDDQGARITLQVTLENVGQMPAIGVWTRELIFAMNGARDPTKERNALCTDITRTSAEVGQVIFPGSPVIQHYTLILSTSEIEDACRKIFRDSAADAKMFIPVIIIAVAYRTAIRKDTCYYTAVTYTLQRRVPDRPGIFTLNIGEMVPLDMLQMFMFPIGGIVAE